MKIPSSIIAVRRNSNILVACIETGVYEICRSWEKMVFFEGEVNGTIVVAHFFENPLTTPRYCGRLELKLPQ